MELKIKLKVKDVEIELTKDEALELKDLLDKLCTQKTNGWTDHTYIPYHPYYPTYPTYPTWTWPEHYAPLEWWQQPYTFTTTGGTTTNWNKYDISDDVQVKYARNY